MLAFIDQSICSTQSRCSIVHKRKTYLYDTPSLPVSMWPTKLLNSCHVSQQWKVSM